MAYPVYSVNLVILCYAIIRCFVKNIAADECEALNFGQKQSFSKHPDLFMGGKFWLWAVEYDSRESGVYLTGSLQPLVSLTTSVDAVRMLLV